MNDTEEIARINLRDLDPNLHAQFKARCAQRGRSMKGLLVAFMRDITNIDEKARVVDVSRLSRKYPEPK